MRGRTASRLICVTILMLITVLIAPGGGVSAADRKIQGADWQKMPFPSTESLTSVFALDSTHVWVGGDAKIWFFNGSAWVLQCPNAGSTVTSIWGYDANNVWATAGGAILFFNGSSWTNQFSGVQYFTCVTGLAANHVWASRTDGYVATFDGSNWTLASTPAVQLNSISAGALNNIWAVGSGNSVVHYNGATWSNASMPAPGMTFLGVSAIDANTSGPRRTVRQVRTSTTGAPGASSPTWSLVTGGR
jgi:hypothetical protein